MKVIDSEEELEKLINKGIGFIYNDYSGMGVTGRFYNILHRSDCRTLNQAHMTSWKKYFSNTLEESKEWLEQHRGPESFNWKRCPVCL